MKASSKKPLESDNERLRLGQGGVQQVHVDVGEALLADVGVGRHGGNDGHIVLAVAQGAVGKNQPAAAAGAVDQLPALVEVAGYRPCKRVFAHIDDIVHGASAPFCLFRRSDYSHHTSKEANASFEVCGANAPQGPRSGLRWTS